MLILQSDLSQTASVCLLFGASWTNRDLIAVYSRAGMCFLQGLVAKRRLFSKTMGAQYFPNTLPTFMQCTFLEGGVGLHKAFGLLQIEARTDFFLG